MISLCVFKAVSQQHPDTAVLNILAPVKAKQAVTCSCVLLSGLYSQPHFFSISLLEENEPENSKSCCVLSLTILMTFSACCLNTRDLTPITPAETRISSLSIQTPKHVLSLKNIDHFPNTESLQ